jgi:hypothetical protein
VKTHINSVEGHPVDGELVGAGSLRPNIMGITPLASS